MDAYLTEDGTTPKHQEVRVLSVEDTIETLGRLQERLRNTTASATNDSTNNNANNKKTMSKHTKKRTKSLQSLTLTLALADPASVQVESIVTMCQAVVRCFPKLQSLELSSEMGSNDDNDDTDPAGRTNNASVAIPIQLLTTLLHPNKGLKRLQELTLDSLHFQADDESMRILVKAISKHECLKQCYLYGTSMTTLVKSGRSGMEKLVSALGRRLTKLVIIGCRLAAANTHDSNNNTMVAGSTTTPWAGSCLVKVCRSTTLQEFKLHNLDELREEHIVLMSQALVENVALRKLSILKSQELATINLYNSGKKQLQQHQQPDHQLRQETLSSDAGTLALANMLRKNKTLQEIALSAVDFNEYSALFFGNALEEDNVTLKDMWLMIPAHNGGISSFPVDDPRIGYCLRLNRAGRESFVTTAAVTTKAAPTFTTTTTSAAGWLLEQQQEETSTKPGVANLSSKLEWFESLVSSRRDIDCTFYKLRSKPGLCDVVQHDDKRNKQLVGCDHFTQSIAATSAAIWV